jgi:hypothetical protein
MRPPEVDALAARHRLPTIYTTCLYPEVRKLVSYGTDVTAAFR